MSVENFKEANLSQYELANKQKEKFKSWASIEDLLSWQEESVNLSCDISSELVKDIILALENENKFTSNENVLNLCNIFDTKLVWYVQQRA